MPASSAAQPGPRAMDGLWPVLNQNPERVILVDGPQRISCAQWLAQAGELGSALRRQGLPEGAAIAFQLPNWYEACVIHLAALLYGFRLVPLLPMYRQTELSLILSECQVQAVFIAQEFRQQSYTDLLAQVSWPQRSAQRIYVVRGRDDRYGAYADLLGGPTLAPTPALLDEVKLVLYTSGSTGKPKGVMHTHRSIDSLIEFTAEFWGLSPADVALVPSPVGHIGGSMYAFDFPLRLGVRAVLMERWNADQAMDLIEAEGVSFCAGATPFLADLLAAAERRASALPSLRRFICGGASVPPALIERASAQFTQCTVSRAYGSTELPVICAGVRSRADAYHGAHTDGQCGADVQLLDDAGVPVDPGEVGEVVARASRLFAGYVDPQDNEGAFTADGYFRMGDLARWVDERFLEIKGRKKELIIRLGENLSPLEIENVMLQHPAVRQVAVVGIADERTGEAALAFVVVHPGASLSLKELQSYWADKGLARQKCPEYLRVVDSLPTNTIGKVLKRELQRIGLHGKL